MAAPAAEPAPDLSEVRLLLVEDDPTQALVAQAMLAHCPSHRFAVTAVETLAAAQAALATRATDLVMLDLNLPDSSGVDTFRRVHEMAPPIPIVIVSASTDEAAALEAIRGGGQDYLVKGAFGARELHRSLVYAYERTRLLRELEAARREAQALRAILNMCAGCKKVRDDHGRWTAVESYLAEESGVRVSHGLCPDCLARLYPEDG
jgi:DNA-binding response OmpR family regulator